MRKSKKFATPALSRLILTATNTSTCCPGLFEIALRLAKKHGIAAIRVSHEDSKLRALLSTGKEQKTGVLLKQGVAGARTEAAGERRTRSGAAALGMATTDYFCGIAQTGVLMREMASNDLLEILPEAYTELMCHPGYADEDLAPSHTRLQESRQIELAILTDLALENLSPHRGIRLINFRNGGGRLGSTPRVSRFGTSGPGSADSRCSARRRKANLRGTAQKYAKRRIHPIFAGRSVLQRTREHSAALYEADGSYGRHRRAI